jgi:hypothetical protein
VHIETPEWQAAFWGEISCQAKLAMVSCGTANQKTQPEKDAGADAERKGSVHDFGTFDHMPVVPGFLRHGR